MVRWDVTDEAPALAAPASGGALSASPRRMENPVKTYDWGSRTALAHLQGRPDSDVPEAELWMGAHPTAPSSLIDDDGRPVPLTAAIARDPVGILGHESLARFGTRLPYLFKVLAIEKPLSIQVHPDAVQAARGFAREEAAGVARSAPERTYVDADPKPELLYCVSSSQALVGLRDATRASRLLADLGSPRLVALIDALRDPAGRGVLDVVTLLVDWRRTDRRALVEEVADAAREAARRRQEGASTDGNPVDDADAVLALDWVVRLAGLHPTDPLVLAPLLMPVEQLEPGDTVYLPAGVPHAYLTGVGVEIMASSDNVVRAGLTSKRVDADELLALLDPSAGPVVGVPQQRIGSAEVVWRPPVEHFQVSRIDLRGPGEGQTELSPEIRGPQVLLCLTGRVTVRVGRDAVTFGAGESVFLPVAAMAAAGQVATLRGTGQVFRAGHG